jgi:hypothetical protein
MNLTVSKAIRDDMEITVVKAIMYTTDIIHQSHQAPHGLQSHHDLCKHQRCHTATVIKGTMDTTVILDGNAMVDTTVNQGYHGHHGC